MSKKNNSLSAVAGILFLVSAVIYVFWEYDISGLSKHPELLHNSYNHFFPAMFTAVAAIGILMNKKEVAGAGFAMCAAVMTYGALRPFFGGFEFYMVLANTLPAIGVYCACIAALSEKGYLFCISGAATLLSLVSRLTGGFMTTRTLRTFFPYLFSGNMSRALSSIYYIGMLLAGIGFFLLFVASMSAKPSAIPSVVAAYGTTNAATGKIERLTNLKNLLDQGIISQEDFDKKKQEIINN